MKTQFMPGHRALSRALLCVLGASIVAGCALFKEKPADPEDLFVTELHRSIDCGSTDRQATLRHFPSADALRSWLDSRPQSTGLADAIDSSQSWSPGPSSARTASRCR